MANLNCSSPPLGERASEPLSGKELGDVVDKLRALWIDDDANDPDIRRTYSEAMELAGFEVTTCASFEAGATLAVTSEFDLLVLDLRNGEDMSAGRSLFTDISKTKFAQVIFLTGDASSLDVEHRTPPLCRVVLKANAASGDLNDALKEVVQDGLARSLRDIRKCIQKSEIEFVRGIFDKTEKWDLLKKDADWPVLLLHHMARSLGDQPAQLWASLRLPVAESSPPFRGVQAVSYWILPTFEHSKVTTGSLLLINTNDLPEWFIVLTPKCDFEVRKAGKPPYAAENVLLAKALPLESFPPDQRKAIIIRKRNEKHQEDRFHFLPAILDVPNLVVDLQSISTKPLAELEGNVQATLVSPFCEALVSNFAKYVGRVGTPDFDHTTIPGTS